MRLMRELLAVWLVKWYTASIRTQLRIYGQIYPFAFRSSLGSSFRRRGIFDRISLLSSRPKQAEIQNKPWKQPFWLGKYWNHFKLKDREKRLDHIYSFAFLFSFDISQNIYPGNLDVCSNSQVCKYTFFFFFFFQTYLISLFEFNTNVHRVFSRWLSLFPWASYWVTGDGTAGL